MITKGRNHTIHTSYFKYFLCVSILFYSNLALAQSIPDPTSTSLKGKSFQNVTLELSLKPFKVNDLTYMEKVANELFTQWRSLLRHADTVSIMLWVGDGSEILDYSGKFSQQMEWAKYMGNPNTTYPVGSAPTSLSLHQRAYNYMENPPKYTYGDLKTIIKIIRERGRSITGKPIKIGATFDPGPEFAISSFKYKRHREILGGNAMGVNTFVSSYSILNADREKYAGFPNGIPDQTPFGTFLGRQSRHFLKDMGYDYLWFSNGFGFGVEAWSSTGAIFNGKAFLTEKMVDSRKKIARFWEFFRTECPNLEIQTRGTNLSTGIDLARDGVNLKGIYDLKNAILPPPNSPWAAIDGDVGLEMVGYLSRIAVLPDDKRFIFRYYTHDPWWVNSPWFDRYGSEPHDIYIPGSTARIDGKGQIGVATHLNLLTVDNTYGDMPAQLADEVMPHLLKARYDMPTAPGQLVWVYPFDEYHKWAYNDPSRISEIYYGDWFIRQAINNGLPLNTVISTTNFNKVVTDNPKLFSQSILITIVPDANSETEKKLIDFVKKGGQIIVYGPADHIGTAFKNLLNLKNTTPLSGTFSLQNKLNIDQLDTNYPDSLLHEKLFSGGGIATEIADRGLAGTSLAASVKQQSETRDIAWLRTTKDWNDGQVAYIRGTNSASFAGSFLLQPHDPSRWFQGGLLMRQLLAQFGYSYATDKVNATIKSPVLTVSRNDNAYFFSGYSANTTVKQRFKLPLGAPIFTGTDAKIENGFSVYSMPTAWHKECRFFVKQTSGIVSAKEVHAGEKGISRRITLSGLKNATVSFYPPDEVDLKTLKAYHNGSYPWTKGMITPGKASERFGNCYELSNISGNLTICW